MAEYQEAMFCKIIKINENKEYYLIVKENYFNFYFKNKCILYNNLEDVANGKNKIELFYNHKEITEKFRFINIYSSNCFLTENISGIFIAKVDFENKIEQITYLNHDDINYKIKDLIHNKKIFNYYGLQTNYDSYLLNNKTYETKNELTFEIAININKSLKTKEINYFNDEIHNWMSNLNKNDYNTSLYLSNWNKINFLLFYYQYIKNSEDKTNNSISKTFECYDLMRYICNFLPYKYDFKKYFI
jgi:hypothetical protein